VNITFKSSVKQSLMFSNLELIYCYILLTKLLLFCFRN